ALFTNPWIAPSSFTTRANASRMEASLVTSHESVPLSRSSSTFTSKLIAVQPLFFRSAIMAFPSRPLPPVTTITFCLFSMDAQFEVELVIGHGKLHKMEIDHFVEVEAHVR